MTMIVIMTMMMVVMGGGHGGVLNLPSRLLHRQTPVSGQHAGGHNNANPGDRI